MRLLSVLSIAIFSAAGLAGQSPAFEVASVKASQTTGKEIADVSPAGRLTLDGNLSSIIRWAYDLRRYQISGPDWIKTERYYIAARAPGPAGATEMRPMMQALLAERFKLESHQVEKQLMVFALVVAKDGPKFQESRSEGESEVQNNRKTGSGGAVSRITMAKFADMLDGAIDDPVVDRTGLNGRYDFKLDISAYMGHMQSGDLPGILSEAMRQQLGLDLEHRKVPIEVRIVDHVERAPVEN